MANVHGDEDGIWDGQALGKATGEGSSHQT